MIFHAVVNVDIVGIVETIYKYFWSNLKQFQALIEAILKTLNS